MVNPNKYTINLSQEQRERLKKISQNGQAPAKKILHAQMLLLSDIGHPEGGWTEDARIKLAHLYPYPAF